MPPSGPRNRISLITIGVATEPAPVNTTVANPPLLLVAVNVAVRGPAAAGVNVTGAVVDAPPARVVVAGAPTENTAASAPVIANGVFSVIGPAVLLVNVMVCVAEDGTATTPKSTVVGAAVSTAGATAIVNDALPLQPLASDASTVNVEEPAVVGVPETLPLVAIVRPSGSEPPDSVNVNGPASPLALMTPAYAVPTRPCGSVALTVMAAHAPTPVSDTVRVVPPTLVICSVAFFVPGPAGWNDTATDVVPPPGSIGHAGRAGAEVSSIRAGDRERRRQRDARRITIADRHRRADARSRRRRAEVDRRWRDEQSGGADALQRHEDAAAERAGDDERRRFRAAGRGEKATLTVAVAPAVSVVVDGAATENDPLASSVMLNGALSVTLVCSWFLMVIVCDRVSPDATDPKSTPARRRRDHQILRIARRDDLEVGVVVVGILQRDRRVVRFPLIRTVHVGGQLRRQRRPFFIGGAGRLHADLIDDRVVRHRQRNAAVVADAGGVVHVRRHHAGVAVRRGVREQEVRARRQDDAGAHGGARAGRRGVARSHRLPAADVGRAVAVVVDLDELVVAAERAARPHLADDDAAAPAAARLAGAGQARPSPIPRRWRSSASRSCRRRWSAGT